MDNEKKEYVLYKGERFTVEWYYNEKNKSQTLGKFQIKRNLTLKKMEFGHSSPSQIGFFHFLQLERK